MIRKRVLLKYTKKLHKKIKFSAHVNRFKLNKEFFQDVTSEKMGNSVAGVA